MRKIIGFRRGVKAAVIALLILCAICLPMRGSADDSAGIVKGYVRDEHNHPLKAATVTLKSGDTPVSFRKTDLTGNFTFLAVLPGTYFVTADIADYELCYTYFAIYPNQTKSIHFRLPRIRAGFLDHCHTYEPIWSISY